MDDVAIDVVHLQSPTATVKRGLDQLGTMIAVPQLGGDEDVLPPNRPRLERRLHRIADRFLIAVTFRTIEMPETHFQRSLGSLSRHDRIGYQRTKPDSGDCARSMGKRNPRIAKRIGGCHVHTPLRPTAAKSGMCSPYSDPIRAPFSAQEAQQAHRGAAQRDRHIEVSRHVCRGEAQCEPDDRHHPRPDGLAGTDVQVHLRIQ